MQANANLLASPLVAVLVDACEFEKLLNETIRREKDCRGIPRSIVADRIPSSKLLQYGGGTGSPSLPELGVELLTYQGVGRPAPVPSLYI